jgi:hypothetical protein
MLKFWSIERFPGAWTDPKNRRLRSISRNRNFLLVGNISFWQNLLALEALTLGMLSKDTAKCWVLEAALMPKSCCSEPGAMIEKKTRLVTLALVG